MAVSHRRNENHGPLQALCPVDRGEVHGVQDEVRFAVEAFVGALRVVDDVNGQVSVVPRAAVLAADLFAGSSASGRARRRTDS